MNNEILESIPPERRDPVRSALVATFDAKPLTSLQRVIGGASALAYKIEVADRAYLLRLDVSRGPLSSPTRYYPCMQIAVDAGIAPPLRYADAATGIAIMDFVTQRPLQQYPTGPAGLVRDLSGLVSRLHATETFPAFGDYLNIVERMLKFICGSKLFTEGLLNPHLEGFQRTREAYSWDSAALVSSHNDPNARNVLFDGERLWLIDWETSFRNDPLADIAILADNFARTTELEEVLLQAWLGRAPDRQVRARFVLMRQITRAYYVGLSFLGLAASPKGPPDSSLSAPTPTEFELAVKEGRLKVGTPEVGYVLGKMILAGYLNGLNTPEFEEALVIARQG